jgi:hypothetical protein
MLFNIEGYKLGMRYLLVFSATLTDEIYKKKLKYNKSEIAKN